MAQQNRGASGARFDWRLPLLGIAVVAFVAGGAYSGYYFFNVLKGFVASAQFAAPPLPNTEQGRQEEDVLPDVAQERVNILLLGIDRRVGEKGPARTDTMMVVTLDPLSKSAALLSIPRDLWVPIPGHEAGRINTAHFLGEVDDGPAGGPALAKTTVQYTLGVPIHYYVRINFEGFKDLIDAIGGVTIDVKEAIHDSKYPDENYGYQTVDIPAGVQPMDGDTALKYVRTRHGASDFVRARRQQQLIQAVRDKVFKLDIPLTKIPEILSLLGDSVQTDLSLTEMYSLAKWARAIPSENITSAVIDEKMTTSYVTPDGADVLLPDQAAIRELVDMVFSEPEATPAPMLTEGEMVRQEAAVIEIQNGTLTPGLAQRTADDLRSLGYNVVSVHNADRSDYSATVLFDYSGKTATVNALVKRFHIAPESVRHMDKTGEVDVRLILGQDYVAARPE